MSMWPELSDEDVKSAIEAAQSAMAWGEFFRYAGPSGGVSFEFML